MEIIKLEQFVQPDGTIITLRELDTPYHPPYSCERLVEGHRQQGLYGLEREQIQKAVAGWESFERKIGSKIR